MYAPPGGIGGALVGAPFPPVGGRYAPPGGGGGAVVRVSVESAVLGAVGGA